MLQQLQISQTWDETILGYYSFQNYTAFEAACAWVHANNGTNKMKFNLLIYF